jgi:hypothetical protein
LGFADFYCRSIDGFSKVARPLTALTALNWTEAARSAFATSKHLFTVAPILVHFHPEKPTVMVETDASDFTLGAVLSQVQETKRLHPVAYHLRKFKPAEINYDVREMRRLRNGIATTKKSRPDDKRVGQSTSPRSTLRLHTGPARKTRKKDVLSRRWDNALKEGSEASPVSFFQTFPESKRIRWFPESKRTQRETSSKAQWL